MTRLMKFFCFIVLVLVFLGFLIALSALSGCGEHVVEKPVQQEPVPIPSPTTNPTPPAGGKPSYTEMKTLLNDYCQACHSTAQFMQSETALKSSRAKDYLWSRRMPPANAAKALPDEVRNRMLTYF